MRSSMLKLLMSIALLSSAISLSALEESSNDAKILQYVKQSISANENYSLEKVSIVKKEALQDVAGWFVYFLQIDLKLTKQPEKVVHVNDMIFSNGTLMSKDFTQLSNGRSIKGKFSLDLDAKAYNQEHLLAGNLNAPHKLVIFSDPLCPYCMDFVPEVVADVQKHPETFALFYYHFPLSIHPASSTLVKAMALAEERGDKEITQKVYLAYLDIQEADEKKVLEAFNKTFNKNFSVEEINQPTLLKRIANDEALANALMINGTPTIFLDGKKDDSKRTYKTYMKESK